MLEFFKMRKRRKSLGSWFYLSLLVFGFLFFCFFYYFRTWDRKSDFLLVFLGKEELHLLNFSPAREKVNWYVLDSDISLLVPGGYGWYPVSSLAGLIEQEGKEGLADEILFMNFGLVADKITMASFDETSDLVRLLNQSGVSLLNRWKLKFFVEKNYSQGPFEIESGLIEVSEERRGIDRNWWLGAWVRDLADAEIIEGDFSLEILNGGAGNGSALRIGELMSMAGLDVTKIADISDEDGSCRVEYGQEVGDSEVLRGWRKIFKDRVLFFEKEDLNSDFRLVITKDCFLDIDE